LLDVGNHADDGGFEFGLVVVVEVGGDGVAAVREEFALEGLVDDDGAGRVLIGVEAF
jgi:hypothetical protein